MMVFYLACHRNNDSLWFGWWQDVTMNSNGASVGFNVGVGGVCGRVSDVGALCGVGIKDANEFDTPFLNVLIPFDPVVIVPNKSLKCPWICFCLEWGAI